MAANLTSSTPQAQMLADAERRQQIRADAIDRIGERLTGADRQLILEMLGLDGTEYESGKCRRCGNQLPQDHRTSCRRVACRTAAAEEALSLAAGANMPLPKGLT